MSLTRDDVIQIGHLARLSLTDVEIQSFQEQLSAILDYADRLKTVDTGGVSPTAFVNQSGSCLRDDEAKPGLELKAVLQNTSRSEADQFRVPPVLDEV